MDPILPETFRHFDVLLPFVVYVAQRRSLVEGLILTLFSSHLFSLCSSAPIGVFVTHYLILFVLVRLVNYVLYASQWYSIMALLFSVTFVGHFSLAGVALFFDHSWPIFGKGFWLVWYWIINSFLGYFVYVGMTVLDLVSAKQPRVNIELGEDGL